MSTAQEATNKATVRRAIDATNTHDAQLISKTFDEAFEPDVAQAEKEVFARLHRAFPDLRVTIEDLMAEGDKVVARNTVTGTHQGEYMGVPPTGKSITYNEIFILPFAGGRIAEVSGVVDLFSLMKQFGAIQA